jgi:hypothetical protein
VGGNRKAFGADAFTKSEQRVMSAQVFLRRFHAFVDLDLLYAGITLDVKNAIRTEEVVVKFLCTANVQDCVRFAIQLANLF